MSSEVDRVTKTVRARGSREIQGKHWDAEGVVCEGPTAEKFERFRGRVDEEKRRYP